MYEQANEQADEQPNAQPNAQADASAYAHNKLNYTKLFYYLININTGEGEKNFSDENRFIEFSQAKGIIRILRNLGIYIENPETLKLMDGTKIYYLIIQYAAIEELYFSSYKLYLNLLTKEVFMTKFLKTLQYLKKDGIRIDEKISYFLASLQNYFCFEYEKKVIEQ